MRTNGTFSSTVMFQNMIRKIVYIKRFKIFQSQFVITFKTRNIIFWFWMLFLVMSINISDLTIKIAVITVIGKFFGDCSKTEKGINCTVYMLLFKILFPFWYWLFLNSELHLLEQILICLNSTFTLN